MKVNFRNGRWFVGNLEVDVEILSPLVGIDFGYKDGIKGPSEGELAANVYSEIYKKDPVALVRANGYQSCIGQESHIPEQQVADGRVPGETKGHMVFQFLRFTLKEDKNSGQRQSG